MVLLLGLQVPNAELGKFFDLKFKLGLIFDLRLDLRVVKLVFEFDLRFKLLNLELKLSDLGGVKADTRPLLVRPMCFSASYNDGLD